MLGFAIEIPVGYEIIFDWFSCSDRKAIIQEWKSNEDSCIRPCLLSLSMKIKRNPTMRTIELPD